MLVMEEVNMMMVVELDEWDEGAESRCGCVRSESSGQSGRSLKV